MSDAHAIIAGSSLKQLVSDLTRFPSIGSFAGSEMINLGAKDGHIIGTSFGVVLSKSQARAEGTLPLTAIDERILQAFAGLCDESSKVKIELAGKQVVLRCGSREVTVPFTKGTVHSTNAKAIMAAAQQELKMSNGVAATLGLLGDIAFSDASKPELQAIMLCNNGLALAANQKAVASIQVGCEVPEHTALPIPIAKVLTEGAIVYASPTETLVRTATAVYVMPSPVRAQKEFPVSAIEGYGKLKSSAFAECTGIALCKAVSDCNAVLGTAAKTEAALKLECKPGRIEATAENGGARFRGVFKADCASNVTTHAPIEELLHILPLLEAEKNLTLAIGTEHGELFVRFSRGWIMCPEWRK